MDFSKLLEELEPASSFELFRLRVGINRLLDDPKRVKAIRERLIIGHRIHFFDPDDNREYEGIIKKLNSTTLVVLQEKPARVKWTIPYYFINIERIETSIMNRKIGMSPNEVYVGQLVGYISDAGHEVHGQVKRINRKTATLDVGKSEEWRIPYRFLFPILDVEAEEGGFGGNILIDISPPEDDGKKSG